MEYRQTITIGKEFLNRINGLLKIEDMQEELTEEELSFNPMQFDSIEIADDVSFENGKTIYIGLYSGDRFYDSDCCFTNDNEEDDNFLHLDYDYKSDKPIKNELKIYHEYTDDVYIVSIDTI